MSEQDKSGLSRRGLFLGAAAGGIGAVAAAAAQAGDMDAKTAGGAAADPMQTRYPFYGPGPQAGIETPPQKHIFFMTFDVTTKSATDLQTLLARWSAAIAVMQDGHPIGKVEPERPSAVALETGEALDLGPAGLTVTVGMGPRLFGPEFGLAAMKPALMRELEKLPSDAFDPALTGGDLSLQACAEDPQVAYHAIRDLARIAKLTGAASTRWAVLGFGRASAGLGQETPRNLFGFKDGTRNLRTPEDFDAHVWATDPVWGDKASYQVVRKIEMRIENWDTDRVSDQNQVFGRHKMSGAPLSGQKEFDTPDFKMTDADGKPVIPANSHIALAAHENNDGVRILRRSYNYTDGLSSVGRLDAGLLFISYQNDPAHFERLQRRLGASDAMNEYIVHVGSGLFFVPPAPPEGSYIGAQLFA